jgi:hypothetical protein
MSETAWDNDVYDDGDDFAVDVEFVEPGTDLTVADEPLTGVVDMTVPLTMEEARDLTEHIRSAVDVVWVLVARAHAGRAWEALGYTSFAAYVGEEFNISRSRAYQLLDQAKVVQAIESATPEGTTLAISEAAARDLKSVLGEVVPDIEHRTEGMGPSEAAEVVEEIVEDYRDKVREKREQDALEAEEAAMDRADRDGFSGGGDYTPPPPPIYDEDDDLDPAVIRRNVQACYDLYSSLNALRSMPEISEIIDTIPVERRVQINESLNPSVDWLISFREQWNAHLASVATDGGVEDYDDEDFED